MLSEVFKVLDSKDISFNYSVAKVLSILLVATGHYFRDSTFIPFWAPVSVGLFIFGFSSGYFTIKKYNDSFSFKSFWKNKFNRLFYKLLVINLFLLVLLSYKHEYIWNYQTLLAIVGMNGFIDWFKIPYETPLGHGLWFFTLLIIFYLTFPVLKKIVNNKKTANLALFLIFTLSLVLNYRLFVGHALWLTILSFYFGMFMARYNNRLNVTHFAIFIGLTITIYMVIKMFFGYDEADYCFVQMLCIATVCVLNRIKLSRVVFDKINMLSIAILEIYFTHTYLFIYSKKIPIFLTYIVSVSIIILMSLVLSWLSRNFASVLNKMISVFNIQPQ